MLVTVICRGANKAKIAIWPEWTEAELAAEKVVSSLSNVSLSLWSRVNAVYLWTVQELGGGGAGKGKDKNRGLQTAKVFVCKYR